MSLSTYFKNSIINHMLRNASFTPPATVYVSLHTDDAGTTGVNEVSGSAYARQAITLSEALAGSSLNSLQIEYVGMPVTDVKWGALWTGSSGGSMIISGSLSASKRVANDGDRFIFPQDSISILFG